MKRVAAAFPLLMMTSSNGNIFRVTGHLCGKFTGPRWISRTKASDAELWCFFDLNDWVNNREAGDLRRQHGHYDVIVMPAANLDHFDSSWPGDAISIAVKNIVVNIHIGSGNGFVPKRCQVIPWTNADLILPLVRNFSVIRMKIQTFALKKMHFNMPFANWRPFCWGIIVLIYDQ